MNDYLFLNVTPNVGVEVNGTFLDSVGKLFQMFGVLEILGSATFIVLLYIIVKYINFKMSDIVKDKNEQIDKLTEKLIESGKNFAPISTNVTEEVSVNSTNYNKQHIVKYKTLFSHPLFYSIDYMISVKLGQVNLTSKIKKEIFKDYIEIKYSSIKNGWLKFLGSSDISTMDSDELRNKIIQIFIDVNLEMEENTKKLNMPEIALVELNKSFQVIDSFLFSSIEVLTESMVFDDNAEAVYTILDLTLKSMDVGFHSVVINLEKLNGQLESVNYKNIKGV
jgi:hypothetical protein